MLTFTAPAGAGCLPLRSDASAPPIANPWRCAVIGGVLLLSVGLPTEANEEVLHPEKDDREAAPATRFNSSFLFGGAHAGDLQAFLEGSNILPGVYRVDVLVNRELIGRQEVTFASPAPGLPAVACINRKMLQHSPVMLPEPPAEGRTAVNDAEECLDLARLIEFSSVDYDASRLQLSISVPQASMKRGARGYVSPELWDSGVTAAFINYNFNARGNQTQGANNDSLYLGLNNGFNLGMWRFRNDGTVTQNNASGRNYTSNRTFVERDITPLRSQLSVGETFDNTQIFDSFRFRGVALRSDDSMLPDGERGYAPVIRGTADSNATVEIRQNGYLLSSTDVSPGPFEISDISPSGSNGDLEITVIEADGRRRVTTQAFASLPRMVREGSSRYTFAAGKYGGLAKDSDTPSVVSASLTHGLTSETTAYGGVQWADDFRAGNLGVTRNTPIGAVSADMTQSISRTEQSKQKGHSMRLLFAKTLTTTNTTLTLASYRYSTTGYRTLSDYAREYASPLEQAGGRTRSRFDISVSQNLSKGAGSLYLTTSQQRYWNQPGINRQFQAGYASHWGNVNYNVNVAHSSSPGNLIGNSSSQEDTSVSLTLSLPIGASGSNTRASTTSTLRERDYTVQSGLNGRFMGDPDSHYAVRAGTEKGRGETGSASLSTRTSVANLNASYSAGNSYSTTSVGASGSIVAHAGGINLGQPVGDTFALAHVEGVAGARLASHGRATTGYNGYAIVPNVTPYRNNWVRLDTRDLGAGTEIDNPSQQLIPRRGSVTKATFATQQGRRVQFALRSADGSPMPFGAVLLDANNNERGITDPFGNALAMVDRDRGVMTVRTASGTCAVEYLLAERTPEVAYERFAGVCR